MCRCLKRQLTASKMAFVEIFQKGISPVLTLPTGGKSPCLFQLNYPFSFFKNGIRNCSSIYPRFRLPIDQHMGAPEGRSVVMYICVCVCKCIFDMPGPKRMLSLIRVSVKKQQTYAVFHGNFRFSSLQPAWLAGDSLPDWCPDDFVQKEVIKKPTMV